MQSNKIDIRKATMINLITGITTMLVHLMVSFFLSPYIVANLGEEANGFAQLANNFVNYATLLTLAFNSMASRFVTVSYHQGNHAKVREYYSSTIVCNFFLSLILLPVATYIIINLDGIVVIENADVIDVQVLFACVFLSFFLNLAFSVLCLSMFIKNAIYYQNIIQLARGVLNALLLLVIFSILPPRIYYVSAVSLVLTVASLPIAKVIQKKLMPELKFSIKDFRWASVKKMLSSGIWNTVNQCGNMLMTGLDLLLANLFVSPAAMGLLSISKMVPNTIISLGTILNSSFAPSITIEWASGNQKEVLDHLRNSMKISSVLLSIPMMTFCIFGVRFYSLWMPGLDAKMLTVLSFLSFIAFVPLAGPQVVYNVYTASNHLKVNSVSFLVTGFLNVLLVYFCLKFTSIGIYAIAGMSSILTVVRNIVIMLPYAAGLLQLKWYEFYKDVAISILCCGISVGVCFAVQSILSLNGWIGLIIMVIISVIITGLIDMFFVLNKKEKEILAAKIKRR